MNMKKQSVVCLVVAAVCTLLLAAYMAGPNLSEPYNPPTYVVISHQMVRLR